MALCHCTGTRGEGRLYAEVTRLNTPFIYYPSLSQGVGSNDLGLDRGRLGDTQLVQFERVGSRLLLVALNTRYRASSDNPNERRAVSRGLCPLGACGALISQLSKTVAYL